MIREGFGDFIKLFFGKYQAMPQQLLAENTLDFQQKEMEIDVKVISKNIETIFQILDEYEKLVETKLTT